MYPDCERQGQDRKMGGEAVLNILVDGQTLQSPEINRGIGIYFKNVLNNMIKHSFEHNWYLAVEIGRASCRERV